MTSVARPLEAAPTFNLTSSNTVGLGVSTPAIEPVGGSNTPRVTTHQPQTVRPSPSLSSAPSFDLKKVRRKPSSSNLSGRPRDLVDWPLAETSTSPSLIPTSPHIFSSSFPPHPPLTPRFVSSEYSPSLSSTIDTLSSTPPQTPAQQALPNEGQRRIFERSEVSEPLRTKRKFQALRVAKRLPHSTAIHGRGVVWEVHAAVLDSSEFEQSGRGGEDEVYVTASDREAIPPLPAVSGKKGRSVRFEELSERKSAGNLGQGSLSDEGQTLTSSYSLSKFRFPAPPGQNWAGTFGHLEEPTPPTTPTTLHYKGASFDVVNPHASFLLAQPDFETPGEVDGLLDDYFNRSTQSLAMSDDERLQERSASQHSLQSSSSNGRQRVLYPDAESALRSIMNRHPSSPQPRSPYEDIPPVPRISPGALSSYANLPAADTAQPSHGQGASASPSMGLGYFDLPRGHDGFETVPMDTLSALEEHRAEISTAVNRASSVYPHSQYSEPFPLTVSDCDDENSDNAAQERASFHAGDYENRSPDLREDEVDDDARATRSAQIPEDTIDQFVNQYHAWSSPAAPSSGSVAYESAGHQTDATPSSSIELGRTAADARQRAPLYPGHGGLQGTISGSTGQVFPIPPSPAFITLQQRQALHAQKERARQRRAQVEELPTSDRTYGDTAQLLQLTPEEHSRATRRQPEMEQRSPMLYSHSPGCPLATDHGPYTVPHDNYGINTPLYARQHGDSTLRMAPIRLPPLSDTHNQGTMVRLGPPPGPQSTSLGRDDDWQTMHEPSNISLTTLRNPFAEEPTPRSSEESYADTSHYGSARNSALEQPANGSRITLWPGPEMFRESATAKSTATGFDGRSQKEQEAMESYERSGQRQRDALARRGHSRFTEGPEQVHMPLEVLSDLPSDHTVRPELSTGKKRNWHGRIGTQDVEPIERSMTRRPETPAQSVEQVTSSARKGFLPKLGSLKDVLHSRKRKQHSADPEQQRHLLEPAGPGKASAMPRTGLGYDTARTSINSPRTPRTFGLVDATSTPPTMPPSALVRSPHVSFYTPPVTASSTPQHTEEIELQPIPKQPKRRAAMSSQRVPRPLVLPAAAATATPTGRRTDAELVAAEPGWSLRPRDRLPTCFGIEQQYGSIEHVSLLMSSRDGRNMSMRRRQRNLTMPYYQWMRLFPPTAALFGLGCVDFRMRQLTDGQVAEMEPELKRRALCPYLPLSSIIWAAIVVACVMARIATEK